MWFASEPVKFDSYGAAPGAMPRLGFALGPAPLGPKRFSTSLGSMPTGGLAVFRILRLPLRDPSRTALLQVNCTLGEVPRDRSVEGIRLSFEDNQNEFSEEAGDA